MNRLFNVFFYVSYAVALACAIAAPARAQSDAAALEQAAAPPQPQRSVFSVSNITVDINAVSAVAARSQAIAQAHRIAFSNVFTKMVAREDWGLEPALTNKELAALVSAVDVRGEKSSQTRYVAELSVTFDKEALLGVFQDAGVTFTDSQTPPIILLPASKYGGAQLLWSADNVWRSAWMASPTRAQSLVSYEMLETSPAASIQVSALGLAHASPQQLITLIRAHKASDIIIANADIQFDLVSARYQAAFDVRRGPQQAPFMEFDVVQQPGEAPLKMLERAIVTIDQELSGLWKRQLLAEYAQARDVRIEARFQSAADWQTMRAAFAQERRLRSVAVDRLQLGSAVLTARFVGDYDPLKEAMANAGFILTQSAPTSWQARPMTPAEQDAGRRDVRGETAGRFVDPIEEQAVRRAQELERERQAAEMLEMNAQTPSLIETPPWEIGQDLAPEAAPSDALEEASAP